MSSNFVRGLRSSIARWRLWTKRWEVKRIAQASTSREPAPSEVERGQQDLRADEDVRPYVTILSG
jgi:hypothetical protein